MIIPVLQPSGRQREYNLYTVEQRAAVIKAYLFDGLEHRQMDSYKYPLFLQFAEKRQAILAARIKEAFPDTFDEIVARYSLSNNLS